jgi:hypothetical protein
MSFAEEFGPESFCDGCDCQIAGQDIYAPVRVR